jgi:hypothetical protein
VLAAHPVRGRSSGKRISDKADQALEKHTLGSKSKDSVDPDDLLTQHASLDATSTVGTVHAEAGGMATNDYERLPVSHYQALQ